MRNKIIWHQVVLVAVMVFLSGYKFLLGRIDLDLDTLWWWLGSVAGFIFVFSDRIFYALVTRTDENMSVELRENLKKGKVGMALSQLISERHEQKELVMRSVLFVISWWVLALFAFTSTANMFARGLILGIGIHLVFDLLADYWWDRERLNLWFWQIKRVVPESEKQVFVVVSLVVFLFMALFF